MRLERQMAEPGEGGPPQSLGRPDDENRHFKSSGDMVGEEQPGEHPCAKSEQGDPKRSFPVTSPQAKVSPRQNACPAKHQEEKRQDHAFSKLARRRGLVPGTWRLELGRTEHLKIDRLSPQGPPPHVKPRRSRLRRCATPAIGRRRLVASGLALRSVAAPPSQSRCPLSETTPANRASSELLES